MLRSFFQTPAGRRGRTVFLIVLAVASLAYAGYSLVESYRADATIHLRLAAGSKVERRYQIAEYLAAESGDENLQIELVATEGYSDALARLASGEVDAAIVASGIKVHDCDHARVVAGLDVAPLHILVRRTLADDGRSLAQAIQPGCRLECGVAGTSDHALGLEVLKYLRVENSPERPLFTELPLSKDELNALAVEVQSLTGPARDERARQLPDVVMAIGSLPSNVAQHLLDTGEYVLVPFPHAAPFIMSDTGGIADGLSRLYVEQCTIPAAMYLGEAPVPAADLRTVGMRNLIVARTDLPDEAVRRLMRSVFETNFTERIHPALPDELATTFDLHEGAAAYLAGQQPLLTGQFFADISEGLSIFGAFSAGALSLYGYLRRRNIRRPNEYMAEIRSIDALASAREPDAKERKMPAALARELDDRLLKLKEQLIEDYCENRVQGELVLMSILSMLSDSRSHVRRATGNPLPSESAHGLPTMAAETRPIPPLAA